MDETLSDEFSIKKSKSSGRFAKQAIWNTFNN